MNNNRFFKYVLDENNETCLAELYLLPWCRSIKDNKKNFRLQCAKVMSINCEYGPIEKAYLPDPDYEGGSTEYIIEKQVHAFNDIRAGRAGIRVFKF